jgi:hypothetical protein
LSNEEKTNDYENFEKGMICMEILKKGGVVEKMGEEETKSMPHAPVIQGTVSFRFRFVSLISKNTHTTFYIYFTISSH